MVTTFTKQECRKIVGQAVRNPVEKNGSIFLPSTSRRYHWLRDKFVPALETLRHENSSDRQLASRGYFQLGETFSIFLYARKAAVRAYRRAVQLNPAYGMAWHEIGFELETLGDARGCQQAYRKAVKYAPTERHREWWKQDLEELTPTYVRKVHELCDKGEWNLPAEYLAVFKPHLALKCLKRRPETLDLKACVYSALGDMEGFLHEWAKSVDDAKETHIGFIEFYFFTRPILSSPEFWKIMIELGSTHDWLFCPFRKSLEIIYPRPKNIRTSGLRQKYRRQKLAAQLKYAETSKSVREAEKICKRFPNWKEAQDILRKLQKAKRR